MNLKKEKSNIKTINNEEKTEKSAKIKFTILAIILISLFCFAVTPVTLQNDTYYTIKIGEHIQNYGIDMQDPFSWHENLEYTYPHWLYDLITYWIYALFNMNGIYVVTCILSCLLGISLYITCKKLTKNEVISFLITIAAIYIIKPYIAARAQLVTFILFVWTIYFIEKFLETKKKRYGIYLILISLAIANLHVATWPFFFVLFLPYIGEYIISLLGEFILYHKFEHWLKLKKIKRYEKIIAKANNEEIKTKYTQKLNELKEELTKLDIRIERIKTKREENLKNPFKIYIVKNNAIKWLILIMIISALMGLCTPLGDTPYTYLIKTMQGNTTQNINEHLPITLINETNIICTIVVFLALLIFTKARIRLSDLFMIGGLLYLMLASKRQLTMFILIGGVILARILMDAFKIYDIKADKFKDFFVKPISAIILSILVIALSVHFIEPKIDDQYIDESAYPVKACDFILNESGIDLNTARFYNEYNYGSYMLYRGIPVFIDSRADLYTPEFNPQSEDIFTDFINTSNIGTFYEDTFQKYNITHVICYENSKMNMIITKSNDPNYRQLYKDNNFVIYERLNVENN